MGNIQKIRKIFHAAVYVRLSKDDECSFWYKGRLL